MITFGLGVAAMIVAALVLLLPPFFRRSPGGAASPDAEQCTVALAREQLDLLQAGREQGELSQADFDQGRAELEARLSADLEAGGEDLAPSRTPRSRWAGGLIGLLVPALAGVLYFSLGTPVAVDPEAVARKIAADNRTSINEMVSALAVRVAEQPDDLESWDMLARSLMALRRYDEAVAALKKIITLTGESAGLLVRFADALAKTRGGHLAGKPAELIARALVLEPQQPLGLWLAGTAAAQAGEPAKAVDYWQRLLPLADDDRVTSKLRQLIAEAQQRLETGTAVPPAVASSVARLAVRVSLDAALAQRVTPDDTVFIFARALKGPAMPLAAVRKTVGELPLTVTLDDSMAMSPAMRLSAFDQVQIVARISKSGTPKAQSGDLFGEFGPVTVADAAAVEIAINRVRP